MLLIYEGILTDILQQTQRQATPTSPPKPIKGAKTGPKITSLRKAAEALCSFLGSGRKVFRPASAHSMRLGTWKDETPWWAHLCEENLLGGEKKLNL
jgi:hypothetical protein